MNDNKQDMGWEEEITISKGTLDNLLSKEYKRGVEDSLGKVPEQQENNGLHTDGIETAEEQDARMRGFNQAIIKTIDGIKGLIK